MLKAASLLLVFYTFLLASASTSAEVRPTQAFDAVAVHDIEMAIAPSIAAAINTSLESLFTKAKEGRADDQVRFALALMAGRDTAGLSDPAVNPNNIAKARMLDSQWYLEQKSLSDAPSEDEANMWLRMVYRDLWSCLPCHDGPSPEDEAKNLSFAAYTRLNSPDYWLRLAYPDGRQPREVMAAWTCLTQITLSLKAEAAQKWLIQDYRTATGRRAVLNRLLFGRVSEIVNTADDTGCADGRYGEWREQLRVQRPELQGMVENYLNVRLGDPRYPLGYQKVDMP